MKRDPCDTIIMVLAAICFFIVAGFAGHIVANFFR